MSEAGTWGVVACGLVLVGVGCGGDAEPNAAPGSPRGPAPASPAPPSSAPGVAGGWEKLPSAPLSGRTGALVAALGDTIVVVGGWSFLCPPNADCVEPNTPPYADGAAYDLNAGQWNGISEAPVGLHGMATAVVGNDIYALSQCSLGTTCPAGRALLRYRSDADEWDLLPGPDEMGGYGLVAVDGGVVAYSRSDELANRPDYRFLAAEERWVPLPNDPLPPVYDRFLVEYAGRFMLFGTPIGGGDDRTKLAAAHDPETETWEELAASGTMGFQVWRAGSLLYLNPHFRGAAGGVYDPDRDRWSALPDPPYHDMAGIIGDDEATYEYASGWVLDTRAGDWLEIEPRADANDVYDVTIATAPNLGLVVFGGQTWASGDGLLVNDTWVWRPPAVSGSAR